MLEATLVFAIFALLGLVQMAPSVTSGDAGEFAAAAAVLGVPHAPGYPLYVFAAKAFGTLFAFGSWAYRTNLLSVLAGAAALAFFCDALRRFGAGRVARLGAATILGLTPLWREQSAVTEVFALHLLFATLLLWLLAAAGDRILEPGPAAAVGLVFGLGLGGHQTLLLIVPALILAARGRPGSLPKAAACAALGGFAGFTLHAGLPLLARRQPPLDWDHAVTFRAFWRLLTRQDYGTMSLTTEGAQAAGTQGLFVQFWRSLYAMGGQLGPAGTALAILGAAAWRRARLRFPAAAAAAWVMVAGPGFLMLGRPPFDAQTSAALERFALLPLLGAGLFVAAGIEALAQVHFFVGAAAAFAGALMLAPRAFAQSRRVDFLIHDYGRTIMRELPPRAALVMDGGDDTFYSLAFLSYAQGLRHDVALYDRGGVVFRGPYGQDFRSLTREAKEECRRAVETALAAEGRLWYSTLNERLLPGWELRPAGLLRRPLRPGAAFPEAAGLAATRISLRSPSARLRHRDRAIAGFALYQEALGILARGDADRGISCLELAAEEAGDAVWAAPAISYALGMTGYSAMARGAWETARAAYAAQSGLEPQKAEATANLGVALERAGRRAEAEAAFREALRREPRSARPWQALGALLWHEARWSECAEAYASASALDPADAELAGWAAKARERARVGR